MSESPVPDNTVPASPVSRIAIDPARTLGTGVTQVRGVAGVRLATGTRSAGGSDFAVTLPLQSFAVIEVPVTASP